MKKFTKLFLSCTAMAVVTAAVASSAMAEGVTVSKDDYNAETGKLVLHVDSTAEGQKTLLVFGNGFDMTDLTDGIPEGAVIAIDQVAEFAADGVQLPKNLADGTYKVYVGGEGIATPYNTTLTLGEIVGEAIIIGDANTDGNIRTGDANAVLWYTVGNKPVDGKTQKAGKNITLSDGTTIKVGDANTDGNIRTGDANAILWYTVGNKPVDGKTQRVGETVTGTVEQ